MIYRSVSELIGNTPLLEANNYAEASGIKSKLYAKLESFNPAGSAKDRVALEMIRDMEARGTLKKGGTIIEPTSGNTGIGLACIAATRGYKAIIVMPDSMSKERITLIRAYGAEVVLTDGAKGMSGAISEAERLNKSIEGSVVAGQFTNEANPSAHRKTTGPEIWRDTNGEVDIFVAGVGTGGTITGVGEYLKSCNAEIKVVAVEPASSPLLSKGYSGAHGLQGIGANFVPSILNRGVVDEIVCVTEAEAYAEGRKFAVTEGLLVGISSGAALFAAKQLALHTENAGKKIVVLLPDTGEHYLSTDYFGN